MVSELRKQKIQLVFNKFLDRDQNGIWDIEDVDRLVVKAAEYKQWNINDKEYTKLSGVWHYIFKENLKEIGADKTGFLTLDDYINLWANYDKNLTEPGWYKVFQDFIYYYYGDDECDGAITEKTQTSIYLFFGLDEEEIREAFAKASLGKKAIYYEDFKKRWSEYWTSDDPNAPGNFYVGKSKFL